MREPPIDLSDDTLRAFLHGQHGLAVADVTFLPLGHDASAWVYRVGTTDGNLYFLKARKRTVTEASLLVPRCLHGQGISQIIAPLPTITGSLQTEVDGYALILYPFVRGQTGMDQRMAPSQWIAYGSILRQIHDATLPPSVVTVMPQETFELEGVELVNILEEHVGERTFADQAEQTLAVFWRKRRQEIHTLVERAEQLGRQVAQRTLPFVLCHADIHTANVLLDTDGQIWIVDWDETVLAPKERDLMFVVGGGIDDRLVRPHEEELVLQGYGPTTLDPLALAYYRYAWAVADISEYGAQVFLRPDLGHVSKQAGCETFMSLFMPSGIVALAFASACS